MAAAALRIKMDRRTFVSGSVAFGVATGLVAIHPAAASEGGKPRQPDMPETGPFSVYVDYTGGVEPHIAENAPRRMAAHSGTDFLAHLMD